MIRSDEKVENPWFMRLLGCIVLELEAAHLVLDLESVRRVLELEAAHLGELLLIVMCSAVINDE